MLLRYVARPGTGHTPSRSRPELWKPDECTIPWFTLADVWQLRDSHTEVVTDTTERVSPAGINASAAVLHPAGTVILSRTASVGFSGILGKPMAVSQDFMTWTPGPNILSRYLLQVLRGLRSHLLGLVSGSTHKTIYMPDLLAVRVPLPSVDAQVEALQRLDDASRHVGELSTKLARLRRGLLELSARELSERVTARAGRTTRLAHLLTRVEQGWSPDCLAQVPQPHEWGVLKAGAVNGGLYRPQECKTLPATTPPRAEYEVRAGDILMSRASGSRHLLGSTALVESTPERRLLCDKLYRLVPDERHLQPAALPLLLRTESVRRQIEEAAAGGHGLASNISMAAVRDLRVPVLGMDEQAELLGWHRQRTRAHEALLERAETLSGSLSDYRTSLIAELVLGFNLSGDETRPEEVVV